MADLLRLAFGRIYNKWKDMGDGSHAKMIAIGYPIAEYDAIKTISFPHYEIHDGDTFFTSYQSPDGANIADNGTIDFVITTGTKSCHAVAMSAMGGDADGRLYEGVNFDPDGTSMAIVNKNRNSSKTPLAVVVRQPTVNDAGTLLETAFIPGGSGGQTLGNSTAQRNEWPLAPNTSYLYRVYNRAGTAQPGSLALEWYEKEV